MNLSISHRTQQSCTAVDCNLESGTQHESCVAVKEESTSLFRWIEKVKEENVAAYPRLLVLNLWVPTSFGGRITLS